jgi:hypothetical protein
MLLGNELQKVLRDLVRGRVHWFEIPDFVFWFLFEQKLQEISQ